jgi:2-methylcitrate dehydratase PrpD
MSAGLVANFGSMTKPLQVGLAARNGIVAAQLAERGLTASSDALESPRGFLAALSPRGRVRREGPARAGEPWQLLRQGLNVKRYPVCYATHRIIDAALELRARLGEQVKNIEDVHARIGRLQAAMLRSSRPDNALDAKFSAEFTIACALLRGHVDLQDLTDAGVNEPAVQALLRRVRVEAVEAVDAEEPLFSPEDRLTVQLVDGTSIEAEPVHRALGHASRPVSTEALREKFISCARVSLPGDAAEAWWEAAMAPAGRKVAWP